MRAWVEAWLTELNLRRTGRLPAVPPSAQCMQGYVVAQVHRHKNVKHLIFCFLSQSISFSLHVITVFVFIYVSNLIFCVIMKAWHHISPVSFSPGSTSCFWLVHVWGPSLVAHLLKTFPQLPFHLTQVRFYQIKSLILKFLKTFVINRKISCILREISIDCTK